MLTFVASGVGPYASHSVHLRQYAPEKIPYAITRYLNETNRLYGVLNRRLEGRDYIAGDYSIADMACYPWIVPYERQGQKLEDFPHLAAWFHRIAARPATIRAYEKGESYRTSPTVTPGSAKILFGQTASSLEGKGR